ncbi:MAG: putative glycosyltransferase [Solimicrobium sp.]|jgi:glycosyltransferase involved in cell wall biosynthesis|nr:putative glycosyltransferase [Solimicrobium sp.]
MQFLTDIVINILPVNFWRTRAIPATNSTKCTPRQLLIDVSEISKSDAGTGIQRVVRNLYQQLLADPPEGYQIRPIAATRKRFYCYLPTDFLHQSDPTHLPFHPVKVNAGDVFFGLDLSAHILPSHLEKLLHWKQQGVRMSFVIYDLLPVLQPNWFNSKSTKNFHRWLRSVAILADNVIAISRAVQTDFTIWMQHNYNLNIEDLPSATIPLGADFNIARGNEPQSPLPTSLIEQKFVLMIGTIEPRKGHECLLDAFEILWENGEEIHFVIAGKQGWKVDAFMLRLQTHPEVDKRLHWVNNPVDDVLYVLYQRCKGVIVGSKGEGYGLPLIEASYFNKPVLARDLPVFREIADDNVSYFSSTGPQDLNHVLPLWLEKLDIETPVAKVTNPPELLTWRASCNELTKILTTVVV